MNLMTKNEIKNEVGQKWFLADENVLAAKIIYISGIKGFDTYLGSSDQKDKDDVIHIKEMPKGLTISLAKNFSANETGLGYSKLKNIILSEFERYSILKFETITDTIYFGLDNINLSEVKDFFKSLKELSFIENKKSIITADIKEKFEKYLFKNTYILPINIENIKATKTKRFLNHIIDLTIISIISIPFIYNIEPDNYFNFQILIVFLFYYTIMEGVFKTTIGKIITNTKTVQSDGTKDNEVFIRTICRIIPFEPISFLFGDSGWHDTISKTTVIDKGMRKKLLPTPYKINC